MMYDLLCILLIIAMGAVIMHIAILIGSKVLHLSDICKFFIKYLKKLFGSAKKRKSAV